MDQIWASSKFNLVDLLGPAIAILLLTSACATGSGAPGAAPWLDRSSVVHTVTRERDALGAYHYSIGTRISGGAEAAEPHIALASSTDAGIAVHVTARGEAGEYADAILLAEAIMHALGRAIDRGWLETGAPVTATLVLIPDNASGDIRLSHTIDPSDPHWRLVLAAPDALAARPEGASLLASSFAHEFFHVLIGARPGGASPPAFDDRANIGLIYEEIAAHLVGSCAAIASDRIGATWKLGPGAEAVSPDGALVLSPFPDAFLERFLQAAETGPSGIARAIGTELHLGLVETVFASLSGGERSIMAGTPAADALMSECDALGADPHARVSDLLHRLARDGQDAPALAPRPR